MSKWNIETDINEVISEGLRRLNYNLEFAEDRVELVNEIINELNKDKVIDKYLMSEGYKNKQIKTKNSFLSESEPLSKILLRYSYYIDFSKFNNEEQKMKNKKDKLHTLSLYKERKESNSIGLTDEFQKLQNSIIDFDFQNQARRKDKNIRLVPRQMINEKDRKEHPVLNEYASFLEEINRILGFIKGNSKQDIVNIQKEIVKKRDDKYLRMLKRIREELMKEMPLIKDRIRGTIYFKKLDKGTPKYDLDCDTGYMNEQGDYIEISENKIELNNPQHIFAIMDNYSDLKEAVWDSPNSDLWIVLHEFENLVDKSELEEYERDILIHKIDKVIGEDICSFINEKYGMELTERNLSRIYNEVIPKKITDTNFNIYEEWLYTYKVKGEYKSCNKCNETKLLKDKYFRRRSDNKGDGFYNQCRKCEK